MARRYSYDWRKWYSWTLFCILMSALIYFLKIYIEDMSLSSIYLGFDLKNSIGRNLGDNNSSEAGKSSRLVLILLDRSASKFTIWSINEINTTNCIKFNDEGISEKKSSRRQNIRGNNDAKSKCQEFVEKRNTFFTKLLCSVLAVLVGLGMNRWPPVGELFSNLGQPSSLISVFFWIYQQLFKCRYLG